MKKILFVFFLFLLIVNCSKSSDPKSETDKEVDVSEGQTNWTKYAYSDTLAGPHNPDFSGINIWARDIAIRGDHIAIGGQYQTYNGDAAVWESKDAGLTWKMTFREYDNCFECHPIYDLSIPIDNVIYALSVNSGKSRIFKSINGEWSIINLDFLAGFGSESMHFFSENVGIISNRKTIDGGASWRVIEDLKEFAGPGRIHANFFIDNKIGYCMSPTTVYKTINGGDNWGRLYESSTPTLAQIIFLDETIGFLRTEKGLLKTEDGGLTWRSVFNGQTRDLSFANNI